MPIFKSLSEASRHYGNGNNFGNALLKQGQLLVIMKKEAKRLENILIEEINNYYNSYEPKYYSRTWDLLKSTRVSEPIIENGMVFVKVYFDENMAYHPSIVYSNDADQRGYVPILISGGWSWSHPRNYEDRFTNYSGYHFISNTIKRYSAENPYGILIQAYYNGQPYVE